MVLREEAFLEAVGALGPALLTALHALEQARRRLHPPVIPRLRQQLGPLAERLDERLQAFQEVEAPPEISGYREALAGAAALALAAIRGFSEPSAPTEAVPRILRAMREHARAQEALFPLRRALPPINRFFLEPAVHDRLDDLDPEPAEGARVGLLGARNDPDVRGGFSLYVPESYDGSRAWPLVVALHGGSGHGREFLWSWLREARSRQFLLLSPTSQGSTWSLGRPDRDAPALRSMVEYVGASWRVDPERVLLTGLSDGATYTLLCGLQPRMPFTALAPVSGVLHPGNFSNGNLARARGRRIYLVHGALDWMFPVQIARMGCEELERAGADLTFREIADLSHTYPREENARILEWFDPALAA